MMADCIKIGSSLCKRVAKINHYGREWGVDGFRAAVLYRRQEWFKDLEFSYDMSVPNVAHLDPQRGGCCTVMPYFVGGLLEIPVTTTQDYTLFHILNDYKADLWKTQIELIMEKHGLLSFIVHPDYITTDPERKVYEALLVSSGRVAARQRYLDCDSRRSESVVEAACKDEDRRRFSGCANRGRRQ
jgi:hypothetical protein